LIPSACAAGVLAAAAFALSAGAQTVYRCDDGTGGVLYSDAPCRGGARVDLVPGAADPAAIERLKREQRAFDERQAARELRAQQEALAEREQRLAQREWQLDASTALLAERLTAGQGYYWGGYWPWYPSPPAVAPRPPRPPRPDALPPAPYVPAAPGRFGLPSPPPARPAPPIPAPRPSVPPSGKPPAAPPKG